MNENNELVLSAMSHTWILDMDGTIVKHNGYKLDGKDTFLDGALQFLKTISEKDLVIFITSRPKEYKDETEGFLKENGIRYDHIIYDAPHGERIMINDDKPSGLKTAYAIHTTRDKWCALHVREDGKL